jgi:HAMP domain-containing protein
VVGAVRVRIFLAGVQRLRTEGAYATISLALVSGLSLFLLLSFFLHRQVNRPLSQLVRAMNAAEAGDLRERANVASKDEFGQLATHFNSMLARIERADAENHDWHCQLHRN